jgi:UDP-N-acetylmuramate dehydrogenase
VTSATLTELRARLGCEIRTNVSLAGFTTYRIGGPADVLVVPESVDDIAQALRLAKETGTRWLALGLGSNVLIDDGGFNGIVIQLAKPLSEVKRGGPGDTLWTVGAGMPTPLLAKQSAAAGFAGVHRLIGVPGTVGGGAFMNAGAHGQEFAQVVRSLEVVDEAGDARCLSAEDIRWSYRSSGLQGVIVASTTMALSPEDPELLEREIRQHLKWRKAGTPFDRPCCGSVFRNPRTLGGPSNGTAAKQTAGQLIDAAGLKGLRIGDAEVSTKHANYIVNTGGATAADVRRVIDTVWETVQRRFGVELELEVRIIS